MKLKYIASMLLLGALAVGCKALHEKSEKVPGAMKVSYPTFGTIERLDPALDRLIAPEAKIEKLADGFDWSEGPVWMRDGGYLLFSDVPTDTVYRWKGKARRRPSIQAVIRGRNRAVANGVRPDLRRIPGGVSSSASTVTAAFRVWRKTGNNRYPPSRIQTGPSDQSKPSASFSIFAS